ncbi:MAG: endolytic transglycosylase MltG [Alphaproteobacteria bacterium]
MKLFFKILLGGFVLCTTLLLIGACAGAWWAQQQFIKAGSFDTAVEFMVERGTNVDALSERLLYEGVLEGTVDMQIFRIGARITEQASKIKAGEYEIPAHASMQELLDLFESGKVIQRQITLREGLTSYEVLNLLSAHEGLQPSRIEPLSEGSVLPETYSYQKGDSVADIVRRMEVAMTKAIDELWEKRSTDLPFDTKEEALILASIIEKETAVAAERKKVAGVFINRLRKGMLLQTDPTVIYALNMGKNEDNGKGPLGRRLLKKDLKVDSPYNTYLYAGLPPGPIANPGYASIEAALNPEKHNYLYFVADGSGGHAFGKSLAEHNRNVAKWRKIRKSQ